MRNGVHRIIFDCERMKYPDTGLYYYCLNLGISLQQHINPQDEELFFYTPPGNERYFHTLKYIAQHGLHKFKMPALQFCDIWHATYQNTHYMPMCNKKMKVILTVHDLNFLYDEKKPPSKKQKYLVHVQHLINRADALVCVSEFGKQDVLKHCDIKNKPLFVIHNGTNCLQPPALSALSYKPRKPFLFSIGVINRKKNFHTLLPLLKNESLELVIAGKYDDESYVSFINKKSRELGVQDHVHLLGNISEQEKSWYFNYCSAFALPSVAEGFGLPVAEAMSCGKPLFLSNRTALPEIGGNVSFYFNSFHPDHMQQVFRRGMEIYNANGLREKIKKTGQQFNWNLAAEKYMEVYRLLY
jgi:glycosyltransferase involved in cell wall biosynthesis